MFKKIVELCATLKYYERSKNNFNTMYDAMAVYGNTFYQKDKSNNESMLTHKLHERTPQKTFLIVLQLETKLLGLQ